MDSHGFVSANVMHSQQNGDSYSTSYSNTAFDDRLSWAFKAVPPIDKIPLPALTPPGKATR
jgi:hypothetical protein